MTDMDEFLKFAEKCPYYMWYDCPCCTLPNFADSDAGELTCSPETCGLWYLKKHIEQTN